MSDSSWLSEIPQLDRHQLLGIRKILDGAYRSFSREYGDSIEAFFDPLLTFSSGLKNYYSVALGG